MANNDKTITRDELSKRVGDIIWLGVREVGMDNDKDIEMTDRIMELVDKYIESNPRYVNINPLAINKPYEPLITPITPTEMIDNTPITTPCNMPNELNLLKCPECKDSKLSEGELKQALLNHCRCGRESLKGIV